MSASRTSIFVECVDESTPSTNGIGRERYCGNRMGNGMTVEASGHQRNPRATRCRVGRVDSLVAHG